MTEVINLPYWEWGTWHHHRAHNREKDNMKQTSFFERLKLPKWTRKRNGNPNSPITIQEIKFPVKNLPTKMTPGPGSFTDELHYTLKRKENQFYTITSTKWRRKDHFYLTIHFIKPALLITKTSWSRYSRKTVNQGPYVYRCKNLSKILANPIHWHIKVGAFQECKTVLLFKKIKAIHHTNRIWEKNCTLFSIDVGKTHNAI